jgi:hypothetical protein
MSPILLTCVLVSGPALAAVASKHEYASHDYAVTASRILELAKNAMINSFSRIRRTKRVLLKTLLSNSTFDCGSLSATYRKPFDMLVEGNQSRNWLGERDSNSARLPRVCVSRGHVN